MDDKADAYAKFEASIEQAKAINRANAAIYSAKYRDNHPEYIERQKQLDAQRKGRSGKRFADKARSGGNFIAIDAEGLNIGEQFRLDKDRNRIYYPDIEAAKADKEHVRYQDQRTCLWMAGGIEGIDNKTIINVDGGFKSEEIMSYLCDLPQHFDRAIKRRGGRATDAQPIFIAFGFGYDVGQIIKDMSYEKRWELNAGKPWAQRNNPNFIADHRAYPVLYKGYALYYIRGKMITLFRLKDPDKPFIGAGKERKLNFIQRICIYDTFGFFQMKFTDALKGFPKALNEDEFKLVEDNKAKRGKFKAEDIEEITRYTALELKGLVNMLDTIRNSLRVAIKDKPIELAQWYGAGAIANASLKLFLGADAKEHLGHMAQYSVEDWKNPNHYCSWVQHGYFGARIDLVKQGNHTGALYEYDIASAYPAIACELPTMKGGLWELVENPTREQVFRSAALSMFEVKTHNYSGELPFYALPYRTHTGAIMFPPELWGYYMRDHVIGAYKHYDKFMSLERLVDGRRFNNAPEIEVIRGWIFHPATDHKPLSWVRDLFNYRLEIVAADKKDSRGQVIKLDINAIYGKMAQRIGRRGEPPKYASLWYAAAITAGTQRQLMEAAFTKPDAIIMFATDGIYTTEPLDVAIPVEKTLGEWEMQTGDKGAFTQSGVYTVYLFDKHGNLEIKAKSRGFTPDNGDKKDGEDYKQLLDRTLRCIVPKHWSEGKDAYLFPYQQYINLGLSIQHRNNDDLIGCWKISPRKLQLDTMSNKRIVPGEPKKEATKQAGKEYKMTRGEIKLRESRANNLISLPVMPIIGGVALSGKSTIDWLDEKTKLERIEIEDHDNVMTGLS
jgi:hypothetical protein